MSNSTRKGPEMVYVLHSGYYWVASIHSGGATLRKAFGDNVGFEYTVTSSQLEGIRSDTMYHSS